MFFSLSLPLSLKTNCFCSDTHESPTAQDRRRQQSLRPEGLATGPGKGSQSPGRLRAGCPLRTVCAHSCTPQGEERRRLQPLTPGDAGDVTHPVHQRPDSEKKQLPVGSLMENQLLREAAPQPRQQQPRPEQSRPWSGKERGTATCPPPALTAHNRPATRSPGFLTSNPGKTHTGSTRAAESPG